MFFKMSVSKRRLNVVVIGEMGVGKTALLLRFAKKSFNVNVQQTVVVDVLRANIKIDNENVDLILWDTAGQEIFRTIIRIYFRKADGVLLMYDVTSIASFTELPSWLYDLRKENETAPVLIVGNKIDKANSEERVAVERVKEFADKNKLEFMEASAKSGENVETIFQRLTRKMLESGTEDLKEDDTKISLSKIESKEKPDKSCC